MMQVDASITIDLRGQRPVHFSVVAFPKPPIVKDRHRRTRECDVGGLNRPTEVGGEHTCNAVVSTAPAEGGGLFSTGSRQSSRQPPGGYAALVVLSGAMGLKQDLNGHGGLLVRNSVRADPD